MAIEITGYAAIELAESFGLKLWKYADSNEDAKRVTPDEAREIAAEDPGLIELDEAYVIWDDSDGVCLIGRDAGNCEKVDALKELVEQAEDFNGLPLVPVDEAEAIVRAVYGEDVSPEFYGVCRVK